MNSDAVWATKTQLDHSLDAQEDRSRKVNEISD